MWQLPFDYPTLRQGPATLIASPSTCLAFPPSAFRNDGNFQCAAENVFVPSTTAYPNLLAMRDKRKTIDSKRLFIDRYLLISERDERLFDLR